MTVRLMSVSGEMLGVATDKDALVRLIEEGIAPGTVPKVRSTGGSDVVDLNEVTFVGRAVSELTVEYVPSMEYLRQVQPDVSAYVNRVIEALPGVSVALRLGKRIGDTPFLALLDGISWIGQMSELAIRLVHDTEVRAISPSACSHLVDGSRQLTPILEELQSALQERDLPRVADLMESDLLDWLEEQGSIWNWIAGEGAGWTSEN